MHRSASSDQTLLVSVPEAAKILGIGTTMMWELTRQGKIPVKRFGRRVLVPREVLKAIASGDATDSGAAWP